MVPASEAHATRLSETPDDSFKIYYELMPKRVSDVLLVSSPYDAFIMDEDGRLAEGIIHEYRGLNLTRPPRLTWVSTAQEALSALSKKWFDLVITMPRLDDMSPYALGREIKNMYPGLPVYLLVHDIIELPTGDQLSECGSVDHMFVWSGNTDLLLAMIKTVEDMQNAAHDTAKAEVRIIIYIEDSPIYSASMLPLLYREIVTQTQAVMDDSLNEEHRILKMRARPKILYAKNFEEASALYKQFSPYVLSILSDVSFPREGVMDHEAGFSFLAQVKSDLPDLPLLIVSSAETNRQKAAGIPAVFLNKNSAVLNTEIRTFFIDHLGFGDFLFRRPDGTVVARVSNLQAMENTLTSVPDESLYHHALRNDFSSWLMARSEIRIASKLQRISADEFDSVSDIRSYLTSTIRETRLGRQKGVITDFSSGGFNADIDFAKLGKGSIGGKARGLAFITSLLKNSPRLQSDFPAVDISIPKTLVIATEGFDAFIRENILKDLSYADLSDTKIMGIFASAPLPDGLRQDLESYLQGVGYPLAVRSSSLLEDARNQPCAGLYHTYMLPNNHPDIAVRLEQLSRAVRLVYASTYLEVPRSFIGRTLHRIEDEKMAVILQALTGREQDGLYYPAVSGVAQSHNFYPVSKMRPEEGIVHMAMGLGKTVVEGEAALRFSPDHPEILPQFSSVDDTLRNAQRTFYALRMAEALEISDPTELQTLVKLSINDAKGHYPLRYLAGTYSLQDHRIRDFYQPNGTPVLTFAGILKHGTIPLPEILTHILEIGRKGMASPVEIEFAVNLPLSDEGKPNLHLLQIRPMSMCQQNIEVRVDDGDIAGAALYSNSAMGNGRIEDVSDIIYVDPDTFDPAKTADIASEIGRLNGQMIQQNQRYLLIGPGRWGSADRWLGIPVAWHDISGVSAIIEAAIEKLTVDPSQGTHFFHNITSSGISYITITGKGHQFVDWDWLRAFSPVSKTPYLKHIRFDRPRSLKIDGTRGEAVLLK